MNTQEIVESLAAEGEFELACDVWATSLLGSPKRTQQRFQDSRERLGDQAAVENLVDALETAK